MNPPYTTLIQAQELRAALAGPRPPRVVDTRFDLTNPAAGEVSWREAHVPGSVYLHLDRDLCGAQTGRHGRHPLPQRADFARTLARVGITPSTQVVALDRQSGMYAARLWWMLRWMGHAAVAVLDGGEPAWVAASGTLTDVITPPAAVAPYPDAAPLTTTVDADELQRHLGVWRLIDARAAERFRGEVEPLDARAGHIPGALNRPYATNLGAGGTFKPAAQLREEFTALLGAGAAAQTVHQCGSGVSACHNLLAMEVAGLPAARLYPGSWSEWSSDPQRPVAQGG